MPYFTTKRQIELGGGLQEQHLSFNLIAILGSLFTVLNVIVLGIIIICRFKFCILDAYNQQTDKVYCILLIKGPSIYFLTARKLKNEKNQVE